MVTVEAGMEAHGIKEIPVQNVVAPTQKYMKAHGRMAPL